MILWERAIHESKRKLFVILLLMLGIGSQLFIACVPDDPRVEQGATLPTARVAVAPLEAQVTIVPVRPPPLVYQSQPLDLVPTPVLPYMVEGGQTTLLDVLPMRATGKGVPILMYHYVRVVDAASDPLGYGLSVEPQQFDEQMAWLVAHGYQTMRMDALAQCLGDARRSCPPHALALTFDDGYSDAFSHVLPTLQRYGLTATFYVISDFVGRPGYLSWAELAVLRAAGMEVGAHSVSHVDLTALDEVEAKRQIAQSKADLSRALGIEVRSFCYPAGRYDRAIEGFVEAAGFLSATTTRGDADEYDLMALPRLRVAGGMTIAQFAALIQGGG